ncbi:hypothetical protein TSUD_146110 [Trifolium subterraneum]|uniref:Uncharacterized protein n=1 Tax=Trifolium subterraneum TaxID=3900 RepID=A0A2Z6N7L7_TRISU|nr:hypothetical protein TSUD_146110 [Trifolium subterraneum]
MLRVSSCGGCGDEDDDDDDDDNGLEGTVHGVDEFCFLRTIQSGEGVRDNRQSGGFVDMKKVVVDGCGVLMNNGTVHGGGSATVLNGCSLWW